jgi:hypothetical protein
LQAENKPVRRVLVEVLSRIKDRRATAALAVRALVGAAAPDVEVRLRLPVDNH